MRMEQILGSEFNDFLKSLDSPSEKSIYVNESKISVDDFKNIVDFPIEQIPYDHAGFYVDQEKKGRHPLHHAGAFYLQEPSAMFTVNAFKFKGDEKVLDMCAAPGGKTIQIANRVPNGIVVSNEITKARSEILFSNVERMGLKNVVVANDSPENIGKAYANTFDVCLVDAPCSGEGMFRKGDKMIESWNPSLNVMCAKRQMEILVHADRALKKGGHLIYSTCTYALEENEMVVKEFLDKFDYEIIHINADLPRGIDLPETVRLYPHKVRGEGQFVAILKKKSDNYEFPKSSIKFSESKISLDFMRKFVEFDDLVYDYKGFSYFVKDKNMIKKDVNYVSIGVRLGEIKNGRFEPHHYLFTAFGTRFKCIMNLDYFDARVAKYLKGETFDVDLPDGYGALLLNDCPVGGFKVSNGMLKNYYPKGLRNFK